MMCVCGRYAELVSQLEERERLTEATLQGVDKELVLQQQTSESHRKRAEESVQELAQAQLLTADKQRLVESVQQTLAKRTEECEQENQLHKRCLCFSYIPGGVEIKANI